MATRDQHVRALVLQAHDAHILSLVVLGRSCACLGACCCLSELFGSRNLDQGFLDAAARGGELDL